MKLLIQRVKQATVTSQGKELGHIGVGLCVFVCAEESDTESILQKMAKKLVALRIFEDEAGKMNRCVADIGGAVLLVPQFTLAADCMQGNRPSFIGMGDKNVTKVLFQQFVDKVKEQGIPVQTGVFQADMEVALINQGPATFWITSDKKETSLERQVSENRPDLTGKQKQRFIQQAEALRQNLALRQAQKKGV